MLKVGGVSRNGCIATIGLEAIVSKLLSEILRAACTRVNSMREFQVWCKPGLPKNS